MVAGEVVVVWVRTEVVVGASSAEVEHADRATTELTARRSTARRSGYADTPLTVPAQQI